MARRQVSDTAGNVLVGAAVAVLVLGVWAGYQLYFRKD